MILLDTQALVWLIEGNPRLAEKARRVIEKARSEKDGARIAAISIWETAMLVDKNRIALSRPVAEWFEAVLTAPGFCLTGITVSIGADAGALPGDIHGDPADRIVIATARALGCPVLTADKAILRYAAAGHVQAIDARR